MSDQKREINIRIPIKGTDGRETITTSLRIFRNQKKWLLDNDISLSILVRDLLDSLMAKEDDKESA